MIGFSGGGEAIRAPTVGKVSIATLTTTSKIVPDCAPTAGVER